MTIQYQGVWSLQSAAQLQSTQRWVTDPLYKNTTLLLQADDAANAAQNNTFLDSSSNNFTITRNGNTTQGSFTPFSQSPGRWGNFFSGATSESLSLPTNTSFVFGTGDFCVELFFYRTKTGQLGLYSNAVNSGGGDTQFELQIFNDKVQLNGWTTTFLAGTSIIALNTWYHVAVCRSGTTMSLYVNGVREATATSANNFSSTNAFFIASQAATGATTFGGYISNLRAVKGASVYTPSNTVIPVPSSPLLVSASGTTAILTCQSNRFADNGNGNSGSTFAITVNGTPSVQAFSPFAPQYQWTPSVIGGSGYFDGNADNLALPTTINSQIGALAGKQRTYEFWINTAGIQAITAYIMSVFGNFTASAVNGRYAIALVGTSTTSSQTVQFGYTTSTSTTATVTTTNSLIQKSWNHVAITVDATTASSTTIVIYLNGVGQTFTGQNLSTHTTDPGTNFWVGDDRSGNQVYWGNIGGFKISSGIQRSSNFTPPTSPFTSDANTILLLNFTNAGIFDGTMKNVLETVGDAKISTAVVKYGSGTMYFDGNGDYLRFQNGPNLNFAFGTGDFTIELWIYMNTAANQTLFDIYDGNSTGRILYQITSSRTVQLAGASGANRTTTTGTVPLTTWSHIALCKASNVTRIFIDGVQANTNYTDTNNYTCTTGVVVFGINGADLATNPLNAYIDDLRITKGFARYTQNFIPPSVALPRQ